MLVTIFLLIIGLILLTYGSDRVVYGSAIFARALGVSPFIIGMTIVGIGTSLPEFMVSISAMMENAPEIALGTAIGSNITNLLLIAGTTALIRPLIVESDILKRELPLMLIVTALFGYLLSQQALTRFNGVFLVIIGIISVLIMIKVTAISQRYQCDIYTEEVNKELPRENNLTIALLWVVLGLLILPVSTRMIIDNAIAVARFYDVSEFVIGLTILAIGTSLPEFATTIAAAIKGEKDIALGNIIGSNIFNITLVLGIPAMIAPNQIATHTFMNNFWVMLAASILFMTFCLGRKHKLNRLKGIILLGCFIAWIITLFINK